MANLPGVCYGRISFSLRNDASPSPIVVLRDPETLWYRRIDQGGFSGKKLSVARIVEVVRAYGGQIRQSELEKELKPEASSRMTVWRAIGNALAAGLIVRETLRGKGGPVLIKLREGPS
jgi:hypothetical protein